MNTATMRIADIIPATYNPRKDLQPKDFEYQRLKDSIETFGFVAPLVVNTRNNVLISGHQRLKILKAQGVTETEVVTVDLDESREKALNLAMNKIEGFWDYEKLESLFSEFDKEELVVTGFTTAEICQMFDHGDDGDLFANDEDDDTEEDAQETPETSTASDPQEYNLDDEKPCTIYLSFPTKEAAEEWLAERGIDKKYGKNQNIKIKMEGTEYGTATN